MHVHNITEDILIFYIKFELVSEGPDEVSCPMAGGWVLKVRVDIKYKL